MTSMRSIKKVVLDDDDSVDLDMDVDFTQMSEAQQFQQVAQAMTYQAAQQNVSMAAITSSATVSAAAPVATAATTSSTAVKVGVTLAAVALVTGGGSAGGVLLADPEPIKTDPPPQAAAAPPKSPPVIQTASTLEPTPAVTSLWPSLAPSLWPSLAPSVVPTASPAPTEVQCGTYRDSAEGGVSIILEGPTRKFIDAEVTVLSGIFKDVYNEIVGGCDDIYLRDLEKLELQQQILRNIAGRNYINLEWWMWVRCGPACHPTNPLFANSTKPPGWELTGGGQSSRRDEGLPEEVSRQIAPPREGPAANPQGSLAVSDEVVPGWQIDFGTSEEPSPDQKKVSGVLEEEPCIDDDVAEIAVAECGLLMDAPMIQVDSKDVSSVTFQVNQTWRNCTGDDSSSEVGWIAANYFAATIGEPTCKKTESFRCGAFPRHTSQCKDGVAAVDLYVHDGHDAAFERTDETSVTAPESCDPSGDPKKTCRFHYLLSCETKCPTLDRQKSSGVSPAPAPQKQRGGQTRMPPHTGRAPLGNKRFIDAFEDKVGDVFNITRVVRQECVLI